MDVKGHHVVTTDVNQAVPILLLRDTAQALTQELSVVFQNQTKERGMLFLLKVELPYRTLLQPGY